MKGICAVIDIDRFKKGQTVTGRASLKEGKTTPPRAFAEGDLIDIMDDIGRYAQIGREDMEILRQKNKSGSGKAGIGTARTRGEIIDKLFKTEYLVKTKTKGKVVIAPTEKAIRLYDKLSETRTGRILISPEMTANWEKGLAGIEEGTVSFDEFIEKMVQLINAMVTEMLGDSSGKKPA